MRALPFVALRQTRVGIERRFEHVLWKRPSAALLEIVSIMYPLLLKTHMAVISSEMTTISSRQNR